MTSQRNLSQMSISQLFRAEEQGDLTTQQVAAELTRRRQAQQQRAPARSVRLVPTEEREPGTGRRALRREVRTEPASPEIEPGTGRVSVPTGRGFGVEAGTGRVSPTEARQQARAALEREREREAPAAREVAEPAPRQAPMPAIQPRIAQATVSELSRELQRPEVAAKDLIQAGAPRERVRRAERLSIAQRRLAEFQTSPDQFNVSAALREKVPTRVLKNAGISDEIIQLARERNKVLDRIVDLDTGKPTSRNNQKVRDILRETVTLTGAETETFNRDDLERRYDRQRQELIRVYNQKVIDLAREGKGERPVTTREEFVLQNLGTRDGYVNGILRQQDNLKALAAKGKEVGRFTKEAAQASVPIYGTIRTWDEDPNWARAASVAADVAFFIPVIGQVSAGVRTGRGFKAIAREATISSIRAETVGQIEAIAHPIQTTRALIRPSVDLLNPRRVPTTSVANKDSTIRIPAEREFTTKFGGHQAYPFAVKVPAGSVEGMGVATVEVPRAGGKALPTNQAAREFLEGRDLATMRLVRGQDGKSFVGTDSQGRQIEVNIPKAPFSRTVGAAAFHGTPDLRPYLPGIEVGGKEGGLFIAPTALTRFIRASATGEAAQLAPDVQRRIEALPNKTKAALGINRVSDQPIPGALVIRDPEVLNKLQGSGKFWRGTGEIELVVPNGTQLPPPSQFIKTRNEAGETIHLAIIGKPLSKREIAKLKVVGLKESVGTIFSRPGTSAARSFGTDDRRTARQMAQMSEESRRAERLFIEASEARKAGRVADSDRLIQRAEEMADRAADSLTRAQRRAGTDFANRRIDPAVLYTGRQDITRALTESELGRAPTRQQVARNRFRNSVSTVVDARPRERGPSPDRPRAGRPRADVPDTRPPQPPTREQLRRVSPVSPVPPVEPPRRREPPPPDGRRPPPPDGGRAPEPPRDRRPPPPDGGRGPKPDLPGDAEKALRPGEFPRTVTWRQGLFNVTVNLDTGQKSFSKAPGTGKGTSPDDTFRVLTKDRTPPPVREFDQGIVKLNVTPRRVAFSRRKLKK